MTVNRKVTGRSKSIPVGLGIGTAAALSVTLTGSMISAWLISKEKIPEDAVGYCAMVILLLSSAAGSYAAQLLVKHRQLLVCAATAGLYFLSLLAITALCFGGQYEGMPVTGLIIACGCILVVMTGNRGEGARHRKMKLKSFG